MGHTVNGTLAVANVARLIRATATQRPCFCSLPAMSDLKMPWAVGRESVVRIIVCTALAPRTRWGGWRQTPFRHLEGRYEVSIGLRVKLGFDCALPTGIQDALPDSVFNSRAHLPMVLGR